MKLMIEAMMRYKLKDFSNCLLELNNYFLQVCLLIYKYTNMMVMVIIWMTKKMNDTVVSSAVDIVNKRECMHTEHIPLM